MILIKLATFFPGHGRQRVRERRHLVVGAEVRSHVDHDRSHRRKLRHRLHGRCHSHYLLRWLSGVLQTKVHLDRPRRDGSGLVPLLPSALHRRTLPQP